MQNRPDISLLKNTYLETYHSIEACLMRHNFSLLLPRKIENQVFDIMLTAQKQKVPTKKLECNKDLNEFCNNLIHDYNKSVSVVQQILEGIFTFSLLIFFFSSLDMLFDKGIFTSTIITCILIFSGYFISNTILRHKKGYNPKLRSLLTFGLVLVPFMLISFLKNKVAFLIMTLPFTNSLLLILSTSIISIISYLILTKRYDLFVFVKNK